MSNNNETVVLSGLTKEQKAYVIALLANEKNLKDVQIQERPVAQNESKSIEGQGIIELDDHLSIQAFNVEAATFFQKAIGELAVGTSIFTILPKEHHASFKTVVQRISKGGYGSESIEIFVTSDSKNHQLVELWLSNAHKTRKNGYTLELRHLPTQKLRKHFEKVEKNTARLGALQHSLIHYVLRTDLFGNHIYWNDLFEKDYKWLYKNGIYGTSGLVSVCEYDHDKALEIVEKCLSNPGKIFVVELDKPAKDGSIKTTLWEFVCIVDAKGTPFEIQCTGIEITPYKTIKESEKLLKEAQSMAKMGNWNYDLKTGKVSWSDGLFEVFDLQKDDFKESYPSFLNFVADEDKNRVEQVSKQAQETGDPFHIQYRIITPKGVERFVEEYGFAEFDNEKKYITRLYGTAQDVTEQVITQRQLRESYDLIQKITAQIPGVVYQYRLFPDGHSCFPYSSAGMTRIYGFHPDELKEDASAVFQRLHPDDLERVKADIFRSAAELSHFYCEFRVILPGNRLEWRLSDAEPELLSDGSVLWHGVISDITEAKEREERLRQLNQAVEQSPNVVIITNASARIEYVNAQYERSTGYSLEEVKNKKPKFLEGDLHPPAYYETIWKTISNGKVWRGNLYNRTKKGTYFWEAATISPIFDEHNTITHYLAIKENISEKKEAEEKLRLSEEKYRIVADNTFNWEFWESPEGEYIYISPSVFNISGFQPEDFMRNKNLMLDIIHPDDRARYSNHRSKIETAGIQEELVLRIFAKSGQLRYVQHLCQSVFDAMGNFLGIRGSNIDITERFEYQQRLENSEKRFRAILESIPMISVQGYNSQREVIYWNKGSVAIYGYTKEDAYGEKMENLIVFEKDVKQTITTLNTLLQNGVTLPAGEEVTRRKDGAEVAVFSNTVLLKNIHGEKEFYKVDVDLTDLKLAQKQIRESERYHKSILRALPDLLFVVNREFTFLDYKASLKDLIQKPTDFINKKIGDVLDKELASRFETAITKTIAQQDIVELEYSLSFHDKQRFFNARLVSLGSGKALALVRDVTEAQASLSRIKQLLYLQEEQNKRLTNFTHIVSHNLRSHTANFQGVLGLIELDLPDVYENQYLKMLKQSADSLNETLSHLNEVLDINKDLESKITPTVLATCIQRAIFSVGQLAKKRAVEIINDFPQDALTVPAIPAYLDSIVLNLLTNAIKFRDKDRKGWVRLSRKIQDNYVVISVQDNGLGIDLKKHKAKLFGMYKTFHNFEDSKGLGLFISRNQVEAMKGKMTVQSTVGIGSTFEVYLPLQTTLNETS